MAEMRSAVESWFASLLSQVPAGGAERFLFDVLWQSTAIGLAICFLLVAIRGRASVRAWLALLGVVLCVMAPLGTLAVRTANWGQRSSTALAAKATEGVDPVLSRHTEFETGPAEGESVDRYLARLREQASELELAPIEPDASAIQVKPAATIESPEAATETLAPQENVAPKLPTRPALSSASVALLLALGWLVLTSFCLVRLGRSAWMLRRLVQQSEPCDDAEIEQLIAQAAVKAGLRCAPRIATSSLVDSPAIVAWGRGLLLLPETRPDDADLTAVACHELAHLRRGDCWSRLAVECCCALLPWQPLVWRLRSSFRRDCEEACDDWVVALGTDPVELAATLANWLQPARRSLALGMSESVHVTRRRILRLLAQQKPPQPKLGRMWIVAGLAVSLMCGAGMSFWQTPEPAVAEPAVPATPTPPVDVPNVGLVGPLPELPLVASPQGLGEVEPVDAVDPAPPLDPPDAADPPLEPLAGDESTPARAPTSAAAAEQKVAALKAKLLELQDVNFDKDAVSMQLRSLLNRLEAQTGKLVDRYIEILELQEKLQLVEGAEPSALDIDERLSQDAGYMKAAKSLEERLDELRKREAASTDKDTPELMKLRDAIQQLHADLESKRQELTPSIRAELFREKSAGVKAAFEAATEGARMLQDDIQALEEKAAPLKAVLARNQASRKGELSLLPSESQLRAALERKIAEVRREAARSELSALEREKLQQHLRMLEEKQQALQHLLQSAARLVGSDQALYSSDQTKIVSKVRTNQDASPAVGDEAEPYRIAPPDILLIDSVNLNRSEPNIIRGDRLKIEVTATPEDEPISGLFKVDSRGRVTLGPSYGMVEVGGLDADQAAAKIKKHLGNILIEPGVAVEIAESTPLQKIAGEHLVAPDGRVNLGVYGSVNLAGKTPDEARSTIETHLEKQGYEATISVSVMGYNSHVYYVILERDVKIVHDHYSELQTTINRYPLTGNETVLDALSQSSARLSGKAQVTLRRPLPDGEEKRLDVDWKSIVAGESTATNHRLQAGDRLYVREQGERQPAADKKSSVEVDVPKER